MLIDYCLLRHPDVLSSIAEASQQQIALLKNIVAHLTLAQIRRALFPDHTRPQMLLVNNLWFFTTLEVPYRLFAAACHDLNAAQRAMIINMFFRKKHRHYNNYIFHLLSTPSLIHSYIKTPGLNPSFLFGITNMLFSKKGAIFLHLYKKTYQICELYYLLLSLGPVNIAQQSLREIRNILSSQDPTMFAAILPLLSDIAATERHINADWSDIISFMNVTSQCSFTDHDVSIDELNAAFLSEERLPELLFSTSSNLCDESNRSAFSFI
jgi:hypothetical protein